MISTYTIFEYGFLCSVGVKSAHYTALPIKAFKALKRLAMDNDTESSSAFLQIRHVKGSELIQVKNYVGVLFLTDDIQLEILPKTVRNVTAENQEQKFTQARKQVLSMLQTLREFKHLTSSSSSIESINLPLLEIFIQQFLESVNYLIKRGIRSDYVRQQDNLPFQKGKLLVSKQIKHNSTMQHRFYVEYDEYLQDRAENRVIHTTLKKVASYARSVKSQKLCRELLVLFSDIPITRQPDKDLRQCRLTRGMEHYQAPLDWARLILKGESPLSMQGNTSATSLLFPMEVVFEAYAEKVLRRQISEKYDLKAQAQTYSLATYNGSSFFKLKPDFLIRSKNKDIAVFDTKWKLIDSSLSTSSDKFGISQADLYQMFAYGHKYLNGEGDIYLIYPAHDSFLEPLEHAFEIGCNDKSLKVWVVPFVIGETTSKSYLKIPTSSLLNQEKAFEPL